MRKLALLSLFVSMALSACRGGHLVVPNVENCTVAGVIAAGAFCSETITGKTRDLTMNELFDFLEPQAAHDDVPARAGAVCQSAEQWNAQKTVLEQACRILGKDCTYEMQQTVRSMQEFERTQTRWLK